MRARHRLCGEYETARNAVYPNLESRKFGGIGKRHPRCNIVFDSSS